MRVLFIVKSKTIETLGPMYLAAVVKKCGHEAKICDILEAPIVAGVWKPDIIGYSVMTGDQERFKALNNRLKESLSFKTLFGGPHATFFPEDFWDGDHINPDTVIFSGEAENSIVHFLESGDKVFSLYDIDSFPEPDRNDFPGHRIRDFITSRGCPYNCSYCYNQRWSQMYSGNPVRTRSVDKVIAEINRVSPEFVYFQDSCFGVSMSWLREFSDTYGRLINIPFHCHLRPAQVTEERVLLLKDARCVSVRIALETASEPLLKLLNREQTDLRQVKDSVRMLKKWGIKLMLQNMVGIPTGTIEDDMETLEFNIRCRPAYGWCSIFQPYPGTELGDRCKIEGWYKGDYSEISDCFFDGSVLEFTDLYKEQLVYLQKIFALAVECQVMPQISELTQENFPKLVHRMLRTVGDKRLYPGVM